VNNRYPYPLQKQTPSTINHTSTPNSPKKTIFCTTSTENKRIKENLKTPDEFSGNEAKSHQISQLCSFPETKANTPVEQIPTK